MTLCNRVTERHRWSFQVDFDTFGQINPECHLVTNGFKLVRTDIWKKILHKVNRHEAADFLAF